MVMISLNPRTTPILEVVVFLRVSVDERNTKALQVVQYAIGRVPHAIPSADTKPFLTFPSNVGPVHRMQRQMCRASLGNELGNVSL